MKKSGAELVVYALEQVGVRYTFGIPGVHNTEIYDSLNSSELIKPVLVTHEGSASFMADAISRSTESTGTLVIVPAAGLTHAMSGIGEAYLDGIPMLIITGGVRNDTGMNYQLHQMDQLKLADGIVKGGFLIQKHEEIISTIYKAYDLANSGEPGPVIVEVPANIQMFTGEIDKLHTYQKPELVNKFNQDEIEAAVDLLLKAKRPGIYAGWGSVNSSTYLKEIAEALVAPVATTLQGLSVFDFRHPLHTGMGFGRSAVPAAENAFKDCDCMLAVGVRFAELATGSFGVKVPENLIHIDINPEVFNKNYPAKISIEGDATQVLKQISESLKNRNHKPDRDIKVFSAQIASDKEKYFSEWEKHNSKDRVNPYLLFKNLRNQIADDAFVLTDDGTHTFLTEELMPSYLPGHFLSPSDFNCMGYCVPATIAVKLAHPDKDVVGIVGDGAFMMTCMEIVTAAANKIGSVHIIFNDGELGQIAQFQQIPLNRKTCTVLGKVNFEGVAMATGAHYIRLDDNSKIEESVKESLQTSAKGIPVILDVVVDYSKKTKFSLGVVKTNLGRFSFKDKLRFLGRAVKRHAFG
ncbi:MAG: thiamine pyrophosphate-binding protein [Chitinophagaceae bacterium]|nr:MAG: thiamine pyrophosphate-binding protein [Chitinophagaceae bacterium]